MLSNWRLGARTVDTSDQRLVHPLGCCRAELPKACNDQWDLCLDAKQRELWASPPPLRGHFTTNILFAKLTSYRHGCKGLAINISNSVGGRCRTCRQQPQGPRHRRLKLRWWPLFDLLPAPPRARHRRLQLRWWPLLDLPPAPPGGPPSTSPTPVMAAAGPTSSTPRGLTIDVSNSGGGCCWTCRQHRPGG
jgi:hypothetical protein